ncbi:MAG: hypothetical protein ACRDI2_08500 [Chloroflexota bacterium]
MKQRKQDEAALRTHPSYDPATGTFLLDRDYDVPDFSVEKRPPRRRSRRRRHEHDSPAREATQQVTPTSQ